MKRLAAVTLFASTVLTFSGASEAHKFQKLCETLPAGKQQTSFIATDDKSTSGFVKVGDTSSFLEGRDNRYIVNQHNGAPIVFSENCDGKLVVENGPKLKGLLITTPEHYNNEMKGVFNTPGFFIEALPILTDDSYINDHMSEYENEVIAEPLLNDIIRDTVVFMRDKNQPVVDVYFPEQDVTDGFIVALVSRAVIDKIIVNGNEYYADDEIARFVRSRPGDFIWSDILSQDLRWINSYPYRQTDVIFKPGEKTKTTDVIFETKDMYPLRFFGGVDNYGSKSTGQNQFYAGFSYGDMWDLDHELIYSFGSTFDLQNLNSHTLQYIIPIASWRDKLSFTGNYSASEPKSPAPSIDQSGSNITLNIDYENPLYDWGFRGFTQSVSYGFDYKRLESDIEFGGTTVFSSAPEINQFYITYDGTKTSAKTLNAYSISGIVSPFGLTSGNDEVEFEAARTGADPEYAYMKGLYETRYTHEASKLTFSGLFRGQYSNERLLSSEQAAISGPGSVRGFSDNSIRRDNAFIGTFEVASPYIPVVDELIGAAFRDRLQGFVFYDRGHGYNIDSTGDGITLDSIGVGARFGLGRNLNGVVEYGREVQDELNDGHDSKVHFRVNAAY